VVPSLSSWLLWSVFACVRPLPPGPDLGACAETPDGLYRYGEAGIGTCLAGPSSITFFEQGGGTFLAVTNTDPYRQFRTGSVLVIDWDALAARIDADRPTRIPMDEVRAYRLSGRDDDDGDGVGDNPYYGGFAYLPDQQVALVTTRLSEDGVLRSGRDEALVLDLSRMTEPGGGIERLGQLRLEDDPQPALADLDTGRIYVGNLTDHSVSVLTANVGPDARLPIAEVDVAPDAGATEADFGDLDGSGSFAELTRLSVGVREDLVEDDFALTWVDASVRLFVPTPIEDTEVVGLVRWSSGGGAYFPTAFGPEEFFDETGVNGFGGTIGEPFLTVDEDGATSLWFGREDGTIWRAFQGASAGVWIAEPTPIRSGGVHRSPSAVPLDQGIGLYTEAVDGDHGVVHLSFAADGATFADDGPVLVPPTGSSYEQPFVVFDPAIARYRMWLSVRGPDGRTDVALSESDDGRAWSSPIVVLEGGRRSIGGPVVAGLDGRYGLWTTVGDAGGWQHAFSWSWDGVAWTEPTPIADSAIAVDRAPRAAVIAQRTGAWRVSSSSGGVLPSLLPAGLDEPVTLVGLELSVANGHEASNDLDDGAAARSVFPGSAVDDGTGTLRVWGTAVDAAGRGRPVVYAVRDVGRAEAGEALPRWELLLDGADLRGDLDLAPSETLTHPVAFRDDEGWVIFATLTDREGARLVRIVSPDGLTFGRLDRSPVIAGASDTGWDRAGQYAGSIEVDEDGRLHLWYAGDDGSRQAIGSAVADDPRGRFVRERGTGDEFWFGTGLPGSFDDTAVADPLVVRISGETHLYYAGFDGFAWHLGHAVRGPSGRFVRRIDPDSLLSVSAMDGAERTFSALGVRAPVLASVDDGGLVLLYGGQDGGGQRIGRARVPVGSLDAVYPAQRFPTAGDELLFSSTRGGRGAAVVELGQATQWYNATGIGMSSLALDPDRGFLYVTSKLEDNVYVVDVRDDSSGGFTDANVFDLETLLRVDSGSAGGGYRDALLSRSRSLLYLTQRAPDALLAVDLGAVGDDASKAPTDGVVAGVLPLPSAGEDLGADTVAAFGGAGMDLTADERLLLVTHFRQNGVMVLDLDRGPIGQEIAWIPWVGENPIDVRITPDQRFAVVANYVGEVDENQAESTLAVIDLDPSSDSYLEVVSWLVNR
jgi:DNA-binding beta-propeller fold protein YncE